MADRNPFEEIEELFDRMSRQFDDMGVMGLHDIAVDLAETDTEVVVTADLPGYEKEDIDVSVSGRELTLGATREREEREEDERYIRRERSHQTVSRTLYLPEEVDESAAEARYSNGVLTVTLPKLGATEGDSHRIDIE